MKKCMAFMSCVLLLFGACKNNGDDDNATTTTTTAVEATTTTTMVSTTTTIEDHIGLFYNDFEPATGPGEPPPGAQGTGPWATRIMLATSSDGLTFTRTQDVVCDQAGVPNLIVDHDGYLRIYFIAWQESGNPQGNDANFLAFAIHNPDDRQWYFHKVVLDKTYQPGAVDPSVVLLDDKTYRLYFMADIGNFDLKIFSATSKDGRSFTVDTGARLDPDGGVFDPMVLKTGDSWLLIAGPDGSFAATSSDGLTFSTPSAFEVDGKRFHAWAGTALPRGGYRLYGYFTNARDTITTVSSSDGTVWHADGITCLTHEGADPELEKGFTTDVGVTLLPDGTFLMAYLALIPE
ncbi:MAG: hypothetical protein N3B18_04660 [Desulfobacterota bacterium]|nr:hypothetical protein [Thermodesulfobacteriota bacterium]